MEYESLHAATCPKPTLTKFEGKWDQLSPKAKLLAWLGYDKPFDRHDWTVNRCGTDVVYIIDYYAQTNRHGFHIDARPALTPSGLFDRVRIAARHVWSTLFPAPPPPPPRSTASSVSTASMGGVFRAPPDATGHAAKPS